MTSEFLDRYLPVVRERQIGIGCSFAPEEFTSTPGDGGAFALRALRAAVEEYRVTDIRLGLRWNRLAPDGEAFDAYYEPFLEYCLRSPDVAHLCIDLGPIKTFRWPEVHVPQSVLEELRVLPPRGAVISAQSELAQRSFEHFERGLRYLGERYDGRTRISFCFNEAFHAFGPFGWTMSDEYVAELVSLVRESGHFPNAGFVINSSEDRQLDRIAAFFEALVRADASLAEHLTSGFDLYPFLPSVLGISALGRAFERTRARWRRARAATARNIERANAPRFGYRIEVTEAQTEPWGREQTVGNSLPYFEHVLADSIDRVLNPAQDSSVIRMWGIEYQLEKVLSGTGTQANEAILNLARTLNEASRRSAQAHP